ncbi:MAG: hypothetical protein HW381_133 [Candidatus Rokubacteria bacterium]|nr:hypothetical protein [Candidatus Rokubacteria bacterium]
MVRGLLTGLLALVLVGSVVELGCLASERRGAPAGAAGAALAPDALEPELPSASEVGTGAPAETSVLTR